MAKNKLNDMSIDPNKVKVKTSTQEVTQGDSKEPKKVKVVKARKDPKYYISHHKGHGKMSNWVCVKKGEEVLRVERATVEKEYIANGWAYCPKKEFKKTLKPL